MGRRSDLAAPQRREVVWMLLRREEPAGSYRERERPIVGKSLPLLRALRYSRLARGPRPATTRPGWLPKEPCLD